MGTFCWRHFAFHGDMTAWQGSWGGLVHGLGQSWTCTQGAAGSTLIPMCSLCVEGRTDPGQSGTLIPSVQSWWVGYKVNTSLPNRVRKSID